MEGRLCFRRDCRFWNPEKHKLQSLVLNFGDAQTAAQITKCNDSNVVLDF